MLPRKVFFAFLLCLVPLALSAQRYISGRITDANDGSPVINANVFISNTSKGATTDAAGRFLLEIPGVGSYRLAISHVAYQPVFSGFYPTFIHSSI